MSDVVSDVVINRKQIEARWLAFGFYLVSGIIALDLAARNIGPWTIRYLALWDFYVVWELASIAFTVVVTFVYWRKYISRDNETAYADVFSGDNKKFHVFGLVLMSAVLLIVAGLVAICIAINRQSEEFALDLLLLVEAGCLTFGVLCLVAAELMIVKATPLAKQRIEKAIEDKQAVLQALPANGPGRTTVEKELEVLVKKRADYDDILDDIAKALSFSDAPIGAAFFVIFLLIIAHCFGWTNADSRLLPPFIAGAVALQLLYSNFVFFVETKGAFPTLARKTLPALDGLTPMIQGRRNRSNKASSQ